MSNIDPNTSTFSVSQLFDTSAKNIKHSDSVFENEIDSDSSIVIDINSKLHDSSTKGDSQLFDFHSKLHDSSTKGDSQLFDFQKPVINKDTHTDSVCENEIHSDSSFVMVTNSRVHNSLTNGDSQLLDMHSSVIKIPFSRTR